MIQLFYTVESLHNIALIEVVIAVDNSGFNCEVRLVIKDTRDFRKFSIEELITVITNAISLTVLTSRNIFLFIETDSCQKRYKHIKLHLITRTNSWLFI